MAVPRVLSIAGSDSGGGAGIQADLKAFAACRVHGMTAITAITAQNTVAVTDVHHVPGDVIVAQVRAVVEDIGVDAVKIGMLGTEETIEAVRRSLELIDPEVPVVLDPVMVSESGAELLRESARSALVTQLFSRATVVTPNLPEARTILANANANANANADADADADAAAAADADTDTDTDTDADTEPTVEDLARAIHALGPGIVVVTGGHRREAVDLFLDGETCVELAGPRHPDGAAHGSGCTHSSLLAARLAWGDAPLSAARTARQMVSQAIADGLRVIGRGAGPVDVLAHELRTGRPGTWSEKGPRTLPRSGGLT